jgi:hypothetical protein
VRETVRAGALACLVLVTACDQARGYLAPEAELPTAAELALYYAASGGLVGVEVSGNVVEVRVRQEDQQLRRGGSLWARVGPFVHLFTPATRQVFEDYPAVAAVRVVTLAGNDQEVARAMLRRDTLSDVRWRRSLNILGHALQDGQANPRRLEQLTDWGERYTDFRYNPAYVNR